MQQREEVGLALGAGSDKLAVDHAGSQPAAMTTAAIVGMRFVRSPHTLIGSVKIYGSAHGAAEAYQG